MTLPLSRARVPAVLRRKDGSEEPYDDCQAARCIIVPSRYDEHGRCFQTTFDRVDELCVEGQPWVYIEGETRDTTEDMARAEESIRQRRWDVVRAGWEFEELRNASLWRRLRWALRGRR